MTERNTRFYFANFCTDVARCVSAALLQDTERYEESLERATRTLNKLQSPSSWGAHEEGLLLLRGLALAREDGALPSFKRNLDSFTASLLLS